VCSAVRVVVAAAGRERRLALRRATVTAEWEVVGEGSDAAGAYGEAVERRARFLVVDADLAADGWDALLRRLRSVSPTVLVVGVGEVAGADASVPAGELEMLRTTMRDLLHETGDHGHDA
jgi:hypothetical protein